jgi:hypothetical protein
MYAWTITKDFQADPGAKPGTNLNAVGVVGPRSCNKTHDEIMADPTGKRFRIYDDDGELYYEGILIDGDGFEPLDDFGSPNAGATTIKYMQGNKWLPL